MVGKGYEEIYEMQQEKAKPLVEKYFQEIEEVLKYSVGQSLLHKALQYSHNQKDKLEKYITEGRVEISNNSCERAIKPFTVGRKNWMFMNSVNGAKSSGAIYSLVESAKANGIVPQKYMEYLLKNLPNIEIEDPKVLEKILPWSKELPKELYKIAKKS